MPIVSRKEFAELCLDDEKKLNVYISRNKVSTVPGNKKLIDTEDPVNSAFLSDRISANSLKSSGIIPVKPAKENPPKPVKQPKIAEKPVKVSKIKEKKPEKLVKIPVSAAVPKSIRVMQEAQKLVNTDRVRLEMQKKAQDMELQAIKIQTEKIRLEKTAGNLLPIDLVSGVIERHANSILKTFEKGFERIADLYASMAGIDQDLRSEFLKECRVELSGCVERAGEKSQEEIDILIGNYSESLMVGQKKA